jgi:hypothetical protein
MLQAGPCLEPAVSNFVTVAKDCFQGFRSDEAWFSATFTAYELFLRSDRMLFQ